MLVGVGGSGKQSLARLASFICGYSVFQIAVTSTYGIADFKENLLSLYSKAGTKSQAITFLMTDNQIVNERFLVFINDLLSTGYIADLCSPVLCVYDHLEDIGVSRKTERASVMQSEMKPRLLEYWTRLRICGISSFRKSDDSFTSSSVSVQYHSCF